MMNHRHLVAVLVVALIGLPGLVFASVAAATELHFSATVASVPTKEIHYNGSIAGLKAGCQGKGDVFDQAGSSGVCMKADGSTYACTESGATDKNGFNCTAVTARKVPKKYRGQLQQISQQLTHFLLVSPTGTPGILSTPPAGGTANTGGATTTPGTTGTTTPRTTAGTKPPGTTTATTSKPTTSTTATR
jgi:hypothetical protein